MTADVTPVSTTRPASILSRNSSPTGRQSLADRRAFLSAARKPPPIKRGRKHAKLLELHEQILAAEPNHQQVAFVHSAFCRVGLPRKKPAGDAFERNSGSVGLCMEAAMDSSGAGAGAPGLPYGTRPRLVLLHLIRTYLRTRCRTVEVDQSLRHFLTHSLSIDASGGTRGSGTGFKRQLAALAACRIWIGYGALIGMFPSRQGEGWVSVFEGKPKDRALDTISAAPNTMTFSRAFAASLHDNAVPLDLRALRGIQDSALSLDVYAWLAQRLHRLEHPTVLHWASLRGQFGHEYRDNKAFKRNFKKSLHDVLMVYPQARVRSVFGGFVLSPSPPPVKLVVTEQGDEGGAAMS